MQRLIMCRIVVSLAIVAVLGSLSNAQSPMPKAKAPEEKTYTLSFDKTLWPEGFAWFSKESGLTFIDTVNPKGMLTICTDRKYTLPQVLDLLNEALAAQKMVIIRRSQTFLVMDVNERNPDM